MPWINTTLTRGNVQDTPAKMRLHVLVNWVLAALFLVFALSNYGEHRYAITTIETAAGQVKLAHEIKNHALNMESDAANLLIAEPGAAAETFKDYEKWRQDVAGKIVEAAVEASDDERAQLEIISSGLSEYEKRFDEAKQLHDRLDPAFIVKYRNGLDIINQKVLPGADKLDKDNGDLLIRTYEHQKEIGWVLLGLTIVFGAAMLGWTWHTQRFILMNFKRRFSLLYVGQVAGVLFLAFTAFSFWQSGRHLTHAKEYAYDSIVSLTEARAAGYEANAAQARWLLDPFFKAQHEATFKANIDSIAKLEDGLKFADVEEKARHSEFHFSGSLRQELGNITFSGERDDALDTLHWLGVYLGIDSQVRELENSGQHEEAVDRYTGSNDNEGNWAFEKFDEALGKTLKVNEDGLDELATAANSDIRFIWEVSIFQALLQVLLFFLALRPRFNEYPI